MLELVIVVLILLSHSHAGGSQSRGVSCEHHALATVPYCVELKSIDLTSFDGVKLPARVAIPMIDGAHNASFPAVIMANSWDMPDLEYIGAQEVWSSHGYVVLEYEARGWFHAGGIVDLGGQSDMKDVSVVVDCLDRHAAEWHVDMNRIAAAGISYGAGLAVLGAAHDPRIRTAISMSGWGNLTTAFFNANAPNRAMAEMLIRSGKALGRLPRDLDEVWRDCETGMNISYVVAWADVRSPINYVTQL